MDRRLQVTARRVAVVVTAMVGVAVSCAVYDKHLLREAGVDAAPIDAGSTDASGCAHARWPDRPVADDPSNGDVPPIINAVRSMDFGAAEDGGAAEGGAIGQLGFDLDNYCTCGADPESCSTDATHCDLEGGIDNAGLVLVRQFLQFKFFEQSFVNGRVNAGFYTALVQIKNYNGQANDTQVELAYFPSNGMKGIQLQNPQRPAWDGNDEWTIDPTSAVIDDAGVITPKYVDTSAYVSDYTVVANLAFPITIGAAQGDNNITIDLTGGVLGAKLVKEGASFRVDQGTLAGRWPTGQLLTSLQVLPDPFDMSNQTYLCGADPTYAIIKDRVCTAADIATSRASDGKGAACGAVSIGIAFTSFPAKIKGTFPRPDAGAPCGASWSDHCK